MSSPLPIAAIVEFVFLLPIYLIIANTLLIPTHLFQIDFVLVLSRTAINLSAAFILFSINILTALILSFILSIPVPRLGCLF